MQKHNLQKNIDIDIEIDLRSVKSTIENEVVDKKPDTFIEPSPVVDPELHGHESNSNRTPWNWQEDQPETQLHNIPQPESMSNENDLIPIESEGQ